MYLDQSYVRDKTALDLGRTLSGMTWNPDSEYIELFVNSEYRGAYLMTEKVKIDGDRVDVGKYTGVIMEADGRKPPEPGYGFTTRNSMNIALKEPDHYFRTKDGKIDPEGITASKLAAARDQANRLESALYAPNKSAYTRYLHRASAIDFYLVKEFFKDNDAHFWRSDYFTYDPKRDCGTLCDGLIHFGPVWDFDRSAGNADAVSPGSTYIRSPIGWYTNGTGITYDDPPRPTYRTQWFAQLWKIPSYRAALRVRWDQVRPQFTAAFKTEAKANQTLIGAGAANDRARWGRELPRYKPKGKNYNDEVQYVASWLNKRYAWMNSQLD